VIDENNEFELDEKIDVFSLRSIETGDLASVKTKLSLTPSRATTV
jgi:hypothetical protein